MSGAGPIVFVVDDDASVRAALDSLFRSVGLVVRSFGSAQEFLREPPADGPACLVVDVRLPGMSGLDLQRQLAERDSAPPIIIITGHGDIPMTVARCVPARWSSSPSPSAIKIFLTRSSRLSIGRARCGKSKRPWRIYGRGSTHSRLASAR